MLLISLLTRISGQTTSQASGFANVTNMTSTPQPSPSPTPEKSVKKRRGRRIRRNTGEMFMKTAGEENRTIAARSLQSEHVVLNTGADEFE
jgi:hypothetical protein